jgi:NAD(P)-dependent dehydrogenase (short-subunit alcohol dehydrogenase family)
VTRIIVTGSQPGPRALADALRASGHDVVLLETGFGSEDEVRTAVAAAVDQLGGLDQVVHAWLPDSVLVSGEFDDLDLDGWIGGAEAGLEAAWFVARQVITPLLASKGSLVFLTPTIGMSGAAGFTMLASIAEGVRGLAKGIGRQLGAQGVTVNVIAAALHLWIDSTTADAVAMSLSLSKPAFGRYGDWADDIAPLVSLLDQPGAQFVTSTTLVADGGMWMGL